MNVAIIAAAGQGARFGGNRPKQFLALSGIPILFHTLRQFERCDEIHEIIVVLPSEDTAGFLAVADKYGLLKLARVVVGGATRAESVLRGLQSLRSTTVDVVAIHDGVRPFVTVNEISRTVSAAKEHGAAVLVGRVTDTIKEMDGPLIMRTLDRSRLRRALTPQCFQFELLRRAYESVDVTDPTVTDESILMERLGVTVVAIEGSSRNIKITSREDLAIGEALLKMDCG